MDVGCMLSRYVLWELAEGAVGTTVLNLGPEPSVESAITRHREAKGAFLKLA